MKKKIHVGVVSLNLHNVNKVYEILSFSGNDIMLHLSLAVDFVLVK